MPENARFHSSVDFGYHRPLRPSGMQRYGSLSADFVGARCTDQCGMQVIFDVRQFQCRFDHGIGIQRDAVDTTLNKKLRKLRIVTRRLTTNPNFTSCRFHFLDCQSDEIHDRSVSFIKNVRHNLRVPINA